MADPADDPLESLRTASSFAEIDAVLRGAPGGAGLSLRQHTAEMDYFVAVHGLRAGEDPRHTLAHVAGLLALNPARADWVALLDAMIAAHGDLEALLDHGPQRYYGTEAIRAYLWSRAGRFVDAVALLLDVTRARPDARYLDAWVLPVLRTTGLAPLGPQLALRTLSAALASCVEAVESSARRVARTSAWCDLALAYARTVGAHDRALRGTLDMLVPGLCRKAGRFEEGLASVDPVRRPSWHAWMAFGLIKRELGAVDVACAAFAEGGHLDAADVSWMLEAGDALFEAGRWAEARSRYERVLALQPGHAWALPSALFCQWRERSTAPTLDDALSARLVEIERQGSGRASMLLDRFAPYRGVVPAPGDAMTRSIAALLEQYPPGGAPRGSSLRLTLSDVEGPSNLVALDLLWPGAFCVELTYSNVARPDPREPVAPVAFALWKREGERVVPALPPPGEAIGSRVAALAAAPFQRGRAWAAASRVAASLQPTAIVEVLACAVRPPPAPAHVPPLEWVPRVQLAAAFVAAQVAWEEPWPTSARRAALTSMLLGPLDWTVTAAVVALTLSVSEEPEIVLDVHRLFARLLAARPDSGAVCWEERLLREWFTLPGLAPEEQEALMKRFNALPR